MKYIIITPAYNEEANIEQTLISVVKQSVLPEEWVIVDDGSTDTTTQIIKKYVAEYDWIKLYSFEKENIPFGEHVYVNFYRGYSKLICVDWEVVVKLDADLDIDRIDFFECQLDRLKDNPQLGICSGITYSIVNDQKQLTQGRYYWRTGGAMKVYRRSCFEDIGGIAPIYGWDGIDEYKAMFNRWKTRTFFDLHVNHLGKKRAVSREKALVMIESKGVSLYKRGYPFEFIISKTISIFLKSDYNAARVFLNGYITAKRNHESQVVNKDERWFVRKVQYLRLIDLFTKRELL